MSTFTRILAAMMIAAFTVGPVSAATVSNAPITIAQAASAAEAGTVTGTVRDTSGAPVTNATVTITGAGASHTATSDAQGAFSVANIPPGLYRISVSRPGYQTATQNTIAVVSGTNQPLTVTLSPATFSSLRTIASVSTVGRGTFNQSTASVNEVTAQTFVDQGAPQVRDVLNQVPGVQISYPGTSSNGAVPGGITFPNIRNGLSFETASLIDGHPLAVGRYGDYVTTFLNPALLGGVEVIKGPGAMAPQTNYAIGGTVNFRTKDPTATFVPDYQFAVDTFGSTWYNFGISDTIGKLGFVADVANQNLESKLTNQPVHTANVNGGVVYSNGGVDVLSYNDSKSAIPGTNSFTYNQYQLVACCYNLSGSYNNLGELLKLRYKFSGATTATVSYLGSQTTANQNGNTSNFTPSVFVPTAGYTGKLNPGYQFLAGNSYPGGSLETNNEPILQAEVATTIGDDTLLARYYHAAIERLIVEGGSTPNSYTTLDMTLSGVNSGGNVYNDVTVPVNFYNYYRQNEIDHLTGEDLQWTHPYGSAGNTVTLDYNTSNSQTTAWTQGANTPSNPFTSPVTAANPTVSIPTGSSEIFTTYMARFHNYWSSRLATTLSLYSNGYQFTYPIALTTGSFQLPDGSNSLFTSRKTSHFDGRFGATYSFNPDLIVRASLGSAIAPPYLSQLAIVGKQPNYSPGAQAVTISASNPNLVPETGFGWDVGADWRYKRNYYVSGDIYLTNVFNQFLTSVVDSGTTCTTVTYPGSNCPASNGPEVYFNTPANLSNARYEGIELSIRHIVPAGLGFSVAGSTQRGYAYNVSPSFYCSFAITPTTPCNPGTYNTNLAVVPNVNFVGGNSSLTSGANGVSNQSVPYLQGYAEINYRWHNGVYASFGETLYGKNNSFNQLPFSVARASLRLPINESLSFQVSGNNLFNAYSSVYPIVGGGVPFTTINNLTAATVGNVLGPASYTFMITKTFGRTTGGSQ